MKRLVITLNVDQDELFAAARPSHERYAARLGARHIVLTGRAGWPLVVHEKWRYRKFVAAFDRTLVLDTDCWIHPAAPDIFAEVPFGHLGMNRVDPWLPSSTTFHWRRELLELCASQDVICPEGADNVYWNCGVWVGDRMHADYWTPPPRPDRLPMRWCDEEQWGRVQVFKNNWPVHELDKRWNYQWYLDQRLDRLSSVQPWIVHLAGIDRPEARKWRPPIINALEWAAGTAPPSPPPANKEAG